MNTTIDGIDVHAHAVPKQFLEEVKRTRLGGVDVAAADTGGYIVTFPGCAPLRPAAGIMLDFTQRLGWLDAQGYIKRFYYDTAIMSAPALQLLMSLVGTGQIMIGSDYAAGPVERPGPRLTDALDATGIDAAARRMIVRDTAASLFKTSSPAEG